MKSELIFLLFFLIRLNIYSQNVATFEIDSFYQNYGRVYLAMQNVLGEERTCNLTLLKGVRLIIERYVDIMRNIHRIKVRPKGYISRFEQRQIRSYLQTHQMRLYLSLFKDSGVLEDFLNSYVMEILKRKISSDSYCHYTK
ncbi:hypothetical protein [Prevotella dentasini]|uniref:hypothetical protein n=1 Tax=Prevotella dentasini TaxID=589537 RepID=UPI0004684005|nr:hypothetical protein [Prevotella dentasini]